MAFRGFVSLNNRELVNSSRTVAHIGRSVPTLDYALLGSPTPNDCAMEQAVIGSELAYDPLIDIGANTPNNRIMTATGVPGFDYTFGFPFGDSYEFVTSPVVFENAHSIRLGGPGIASTGLQLIWDDDHGWIYPVTALDDTWVIKAWVMSPHTNTGNITLEAVIEALDIDGRQVFGSEDSYGGGPQTYPRTPGPDDPGWTEFDWFFDGPLPAGTVYVNIYLKVTFDDPGDYLYVGEYAANINWQDATGLYTVHETAELGDFYEPGLYRPGQWGVRIENLVLNVPAQGIAPDNAFGEFLEFETLTLCPIDTRCIDRSLLRDDEVAWLDAYHAEVRQRLAPLVEGDALAWLNERTRPL